MPSPILAETDATAMPEAISTAIGFMTARIGAVINTVTTEPVLCLGIAMWCIGGAIGLFKRLV